MITLKTLHLASEQEGKKLSKEEIDALMYLIQVNLASIHLELLKAGEKQWPKNKVNIH
jgi:hypothetical protein